MTSTPPSIELKTAISAAMVGGQIAMEHFKRGVVSVNKTVELQSQGLVTQADLDAEKAIVSKIKNIFPDHHFLGEETYADDIDSEHLWVIDPIDGTNNFAHGIPHFGVSVGYWRKGVAHCGAVLNPATGDIYTVEKSKGAFRNGHAVSVNQHSELNQAMIATGFYYDRGEMMRSTLAAIDALFQHDIHGIRRFGAASLDLIDVGVGRYGGFFELTLSPWDFAAAKLFVEEAGGRVTDCIGREIGLAKTSLLASNGQLHKELLAAISPHVSAS